MSFFDDDIELGNIEIGESLRGMQDDDSYLGAAQKALTQLRGALGQVAQKQALSRFGRHVPAQKVLRSPYRDSTQIGVSMVAALTLDSWPTGGSLPTVTGSTRVYKSFKPLKAILTEIVTVTFDNDSSAATTRVASVSDASDLVLISAFSGADNCFPNAPTEDNGISGPTFANNSLGNGISWPTINGGIDLTIGFAIEESVVYQVTPPSGFTSDDITAISVKVRFNLLGPSLR